MKQNDLPSAVEDLRLSGVPAVMFASGWFAATVFLIVAIHKVDNRADDADMVLVLIA